MSLRFTLAAVLLLSALSNDGLADEKVPRRGGFPLFRFLTSTPTPALVTYTPSQLDPRQEANQGRLKSSSIRADLVALRPHFDGLILYGYHEACTPRVAAIASELKFQAIILGVWNPKSTS